VIRVAGPLTCFGCGQSFPTSSDHDSGACCLAHPEEADVRRKAFEVRQAREEARPARLEALLILTRALRDAWPVCTKCPPEARTPAFFDLPPSLCDQHAREDFFAVFHDEVPLAKPMRPLFLALRDLEDVQADETKTAETEEARRRVAVQEERDAIVAILERNLNLPLGMRSVRDGRDVLKRVLDEIRARGKGEPR
jgi:hypothetical protein